MYQWFVFAVLMSVVNSGTPIKCYDCTLCPEQLDPKTAVSRECELESKGNYDVLKIFEVANNVVSDDKLVCLTYTIDVLVVNRTATARSCAPKTVGNQDICDYLSTVSPPLSKLLNCTTCNTDLCNA
ncbi:unnamed protein product [Callosobruchus maculatus]|uniref:Protein sleepless n=1 Tax=Callosobruchus maculatus TaxID=64391 RepID=A0A653CS74_CALMS|nr:unnamed protein product [Callosobruchus maculatus]